MSEDWYHGDEKEEWAARDSGKPYNRVLPERHPEGVQLMVEYLTNRTLSPTVALENGWYPTIAVDGVPRVVIPATSLIPGNIYWQARALVDHPRRYESPHGVKRGDAIGLVYPHQTGQRATRAVICEGPMDALAAADAGALGITLFGANPPPEVWGLTTTVLHGIIGVLVVGDNDAAGLKFSRNVQQTLAQRGVACRIVIPSGTDLAAQSLPQRLSTLNG